MSKTNLIYRANLNFQSAETDLDFLMSHGYLERGPLKSGFVPYKTTPKGDDLLQLLSNVQLSLQGCIPKSSIDRSRERPICRAGEP